MNESHDIQKAVRMLHRLYTGLLDQHAFDGNLWRGPDFGISRTSYPREISTVTAYGYRWWISIRVDTLYKSDNPVMFIGRGGDIVETLASLYLVELSK